jgi:hypothetical protein
MKIDEWGLRVIAFNAIFNNMSVKSWQSVLLVKEIAVPGENHGIDLTISP